MELIRAMEANFPGFRARLAQSSYRFCMSTELHHKGLAPEQLNLMGTGQHVTLRPVIEGERAVGRILLGGALIGASLLIPGSQGWLTNMGIAVMLGGVAQLLTPKPRQNRNDGRRGSAFSNALGTSDRNAPIPLLIGFHRVNGAPIALSSNTVEDF